jgi:hypothetical protein
MTIALLNWAEHYTGEFGWSVFPLRIAASGKTPAVRWKRFQTRPPTADERREMFKRADVNGLAIVFGAVSGNLGSRDFDELAAYDRWAAAHPHAAILLPTVTTQRGRHVYFRADPDEIREIRCRIGKPDGTGAIKCADGELRIGVGCYSAAPPSQRPNGKGWAWRNEPIRPLPTVEIVQDGLFPPVQQRDRDTEAIEGDLGGRLSAFLPPSKGFTPPISRNAERTPPEVIDAELRRIIAATLPTQSGQRNTLVFDLCRALKGMPAYADAAAGELKPIVRFWWEAALPIIGTKCFAETWADFRHGWTRVRFPRGQETMAMMLTLARNADCPPEALEYDSDNFRLLVALCRELQRACGSQPFFLSARTAGNLLGVDPSTACRWLGCLEADEIIRCVEKGGPASRKASRFRYLPPL